MASITDAQMEQLHASIMSSSVQEWQERLTRAITPEDYNRIREAVDEFVLVVQDYINQYPFPEGETSIAPDAPMLTKEQQGWVEAFDTTVSLDQGSDVLHRLFDEFGEPLILNFHLYSGWGVLHRHGFVPFRIDHRVNYIAPAQPNDAQEIKWARQVAKVTVANGSPIRADESVYGWEDYEMVKHLRDCSITHVSRVRENDSWDEFVHTFTDTAYKYGVRLDGCACACGRWNGSFRMETDGLADTVKLFMAAK